MRYIPEFEEFLISIGYSENSARDDIRLNRESEAYLYSSPELNGNTLDDIVADDAKMGIAFTVLSRIERPYYKNEHQNVLRLYYYFVNKRWYDGWVSSKMKGDTVRNNRSNSKYKVKVFPVNVPDRIPDWLESNWGIIKYDPTVPENERIPGLTGFLGGEYDHIVSSRGHYILDRDLPLFRNRDIFPFIPVVLSNELPYKEYHESDEEIARRIVNSNGSYDEVLNILRNKDWTDRILGEYHHSGCSGNLFPECLDAVDQGFQFEDGSRPYITIYYRNTDCPNTEEYMMKLGNCLAHEYFHFLNDVFAQREFAKKSAHRKAVIEALADFYAACYTMYEHGEYRYCRAAAKVVEDRYNAWVKKFGTAWPYAYAYYFYLIGGRELCFNMNLDDYRRFGSIGKFNEVFRASARSMNEAYQILTTR